MNNQWSSAPQPRWQQNNNNHRNNMPPQQNPGPSWQQQPSHNMIQMQANPVYMQPAPVWQGQPMQPVHMQQRTPLIQVANVNPAFNNNLQGQQYSNRLPTVQTAVPVQVAFNTAPIKSATAPSRGKRNNNSNSNNNNSTTIKQPTSYSSHILTTGAANPNQNGHNNGYGNHRINHQTFQKIVNGQVVTLDSKGYAVPGPYRNAKKEAEMREKKLREEQEKREKQMILEYQRQAFYPVKCSNELALLSLNQPQFDQCEKLGKTPLWIRLNTVLELEEVQSRIFRPIWFSADNLQINLIINCDKFSIRLDDPGTDQWKLYHLLAKWIIEYYLVTCPIKDPLCNADNLETNNIDEIVLQVLQNQHLNNLKSNILAWAPARCMREKMVGYCYEIVSGSLAAKEWTIKLVRNGDELVDEATDSTVELVENSLALRFFHNPENNKKFMEQVRLPEKMPDYERAEDLSVNKDSNSWNSKVRSITDGPADGPSAKKAKLSPKSFNDSASKNSENPSETTSAGGHRVKPLDTSSLHLMMKVDYSKKKRDEAAASNNQTSNLKFPDRGQLSEQQKAELERGRQEKERYLKEVAAAKKQKVEWNYNVKLRFLLTEPLASDYLECVWLKLAKDSCTPYSYTYEEETSKIGGELFTCKIDFGGDVFVGQGSNKLKSKVIFGVLKKLMNFSIKRFTVFDSQFSKILLYVPNTQPPNAFKRKTSEIQHHRMVQNHKLGRTTKRRIKRGSTGAYFILAREPF